VDPPQAPVIGTVAAFTTATEMVPAFGSMVADAPEAS
jgi:hypothetical protein